MLRKKILFFLSLAVILSIPFSFPSKNVHGEAAEQELLSNPGFEEVTEGVPVDWNPTGVAIEYESSQEEVYVGEYSVKIKDPSDKAGPSLRSERIPIDAGETYRASVYSYNISGNSDLYLEYWDDAGNRVDVTFTNNAFLSDWRKMEVDLEAPEDAVYATVLLNLNVANIGEAYYDNASLTVAPPEDIQDFPLLEEGHPRLFFTNEDIPEMIDKSTDTSWNPFGVTGQSLWSSVASKANEYLAEEELTLTYYGDKKVTYPLPPKQPGPIEAPPGWEGGPYPYWTALSTSVQTRLETLSLAYVVTGEVEYAEKAKSYALALADWDTWGDPLELNTDESRLSTTHFTRAVTVVYDMLYDYLTEEERSLIETALETKGLSILYKDAKEKIDHNIQMHRAIALGSGAAALLGKNPDAEKYLTRATEYYEWYLDERMLSGQQEGHHYTNYSLESFVQAIDHIARTTGRDDLFEHPFFNELLVPWVNYSLAPGGGGLANFSDANTHSYYYVTMSVINSWLDNGHAGWYLAEAKPTSEPLNQFIYFNPDGKITPPNDLPTSNVLDEIGWATLRTGWDQGDTLLAFVANNSILDHNHFDQNSFQIATNSSWIATDPGYADFSPGPRNDFTMKLGHNTIQVDGKGQSRRGGGQLTKGLLTPTYDYVKGAAAAAYNDPKLDTFDRHIVHMKPDYYVMFDDLKSDEPRTFDWILYNGRSTDFEIDGEEPLAGETTHGDTLYVQNQRAQMAAKFLSTDNLPITVDTYEGAEDYGQYVRVGSDGKKRDHHFLTVLKAEPNEHVGYRYSALDLLPPEKSSGKGYKAVSAAGTNLLFYQAEEVGDYLTLNFNVDEPGTYDVSTLFIKSPAYGQVQTYIDDEPVGDIYDGYHESVEAAAPVEYGEIELDAGEHSIRYEVVGQHADSSNFFIGVDAIHLVPSDAVDTEDVQKTTIDAELMEGNGAIGAMIDREDETTITDLVVFQTGNEDYSLDGVESDADQAVVSYNANNDIVQYNMTSGTTFSYNDNVLLQGEHAFHAAMSYDLATREVKGTIELDQSGTIQIRTMSPQHVFVDGEKLEQDDFSYEEEASLLTLHLAEGTYELQIEGLDVTAQTMQQMVESLDNEGAFTNGQAVHALTIHLTAVGHFEKQEAAEKVVKHMKGFHSLLTHQKDNELISEKAYQKLASESGFLIEKWQTE